MIQRRGHYLPYTIVTPETGHYAQPKSGCSAVIPCVLSLKKKPCLFLSLHFHNALNFDNTKKYREQGLDTSNKDAFISDILGKKKQAPTNRESDDMIWKNGLYDVNIIQAPDHEDIAVIGDFERLSQAFMVAHMNGGGYVNVDFNTDTMTSEITYETPHLTRLRTQRKSAISIK